MFNKGYMTLSASRTWSAELPIGDPFGGPAAGKKEIFSLLGAGMSIYAGLQVTAPFTAGLMIAGGILSGIGELTGNKTLSTLGSVSSLAGGVAGFFEKGGWSSLTGGDAAGEVTEKAASLNNDIAPLAGAGETAVQSMGDSIVGVKPLSVTESVTPPTVQPTSGLDANSMLLPKTSGGMMQQPRVDASPGFDYLPQHVVDGVSKKDTGLLSGAMDWFNGLDSSQQVAVGQIAAGLGKGAFEYFKEPTQEEKDKLKADTEAVRENTAMTKLKAQEQAQRMANRKLDPRLANIGVIKKPGVYTSRALGTIAAMQQSFSKG